MTKYETETLLEAARREKRLSYTELGDILGVKRQSARRYCLPRSHRDHRRPNEVVAIRLRKWSGDRITSDNHADLVTHRAAPTRRRA